MENRFNILYVGKIYMFYPPICNVARFIKKSFNTK